MSNLRRLFYPALILLLADRLVFLFLFGFQYVGSDDCIFWIGAKDYAHGIFHEPMIYGQNYGYMFESLLAVPGMWLHIPLQILFPVITSILAIAPFISFAKWFRKRNNDLSALVLLLLPIFLSPFYGIQTTVTRDFVCGLGVLALWPITDRINKALLKWIFQGFVFMLAIVLNPSSLFAIIPLFIFSLEKELKNPSFWIGNFIGAFPVFLADHFANEFYKNHPEQILHHFPEDALHFSWKNLGNALAHLDLHFEGLFPFWWKNGSLILLLFLIPAGVFLYQKRRIYFVSVLITLLVLVFSLGLNKIHDGGHSVFYAASRLYLILPFVVALFIAFAVKERGISKFIPELLVVAVVFIGIKVAVLPGQAHYSSVHRFDEFAPVEELPLDSIQHDCARLYKQAKETKADLIVGLNYDGFSMEQLWFHAGSVWYDDFPPNVIPAYERRTWRLKEEDTAVRKTILFIGGDQGWWDVRMKEDANIHVYNSPVPMHLMENNSTPLVPLMAKWGYVVRKHN